MSKRSKNGQAAAREQKRDAWQQERDQDLEREEIPEDEYEGMDRYARDAQEYRG